MRDRVMYCAAIGCATLALLWTGWSVTRSAAGAEDVWLGALNWSLAVGTIGISGLGLCSTRRAVRHG